jgi:TIR domain
VIKIFLSYSHTDEVLRAEFDKHLALLKRQGVVDVWSDHCIRPGEELDSVIDVGIESADIVLLLISSDFIHSDYCFGREMKIAMERHDQKRSIVVPIILRPCDWHSSQFGRLKALPTDGKAVIKWTILDEAFLDVVQQLRLLISKANVSRESPAEPTPSLVAPNSTVISSPLSTDTAPRTRSSNLALPRKFTDQDRHDFIDATYSYIYKYFEGSLKELELRNPDITARFMALSPRSFTAVVFRKGKRQAGCRVRIGAGFVSSGIAYSGNENTSDNSFNELLSVETGEHSMMVKATMGAFSRAAEGMLTEEGAAEHLWSMFISTMQH